MRERKRKDGRYQEKRGVREERREGEREEEGDAGES